MIDRDYCITMARYNAWQNAQLVGFFNALPEAELTRDRGAFFGSILGTLNHLLWGDTIWMSRFDGGAGPQTPGADSHRMHPGLGAWRDARAQMDERIGRWAERVTTADLDGDLVWYSGLKMQDVIERMATCVMGFFNHQTHHRGQVHAMLTATGSKAPVSDLFLMPEDA